MKPKFKKAFDALKKIGAPVFTNADNDQIGNFSISGEDNSDEVWAEYYCPDFGVFGVSQRIEDVLAKFGLMCEWQNPGKLNVYEK